MQEEVLEFKESPCLEEAADIYEVFLAVLKNWKLDLDHVKNVASSKKHLNGAFEKKLVLEKINN